VLALAPGCGGLSGAGTDAQDTQAETSADTGGEGEYSPPPGGMRRLLDHQYLATIAYIFGPAAAVVAQPPSDPALHGYSSIGATQLSPQLDTVEIYEASARAVAKAVVAKPEHLAGFVPCLASAPDEACYVEVAQTVGHLAWRRPLAPEEVQAVVDIAVEARAWAGGDVWVGLEYELVRLLLSPHFIYVIETGVEREDEPGVRWLSGPERVTRLSLLLAGRTPSLALLEAAEAGSYDSLGSFEALARAMLDDPAAPEAVAEFFGEYLALDAIPAKDGAKFPLYSQALVDSMLEETERLLRDVIWTKDGDFRDFIEADYTFVDARLAELYGIEAPESAWQQVSLPPEQARAGFLTHASVLARNSHAAGNSTTRRGQYIQQRLLCHAISPPPPGAPKLGDLPEDGSMTLRERMEALHLQDPSCAECHLHMDTLGFTLENYDALGAWRSEDQNGLPIDPVVEYGDYGEMASAADLAANVAMDPRLGECVVNNLIRFGRGSFEDPAGEAAELDELHAAFESSGYRFKELLVAFVTSELFLQVGPPK
jgi:hypothetical protein